MRVLETTDGKGISEELESETNSETVQGKWVDLMLHVARNNGIDRNTAYEQFCHDGYGNLFNVDFQNKSNYASCVGEALTNSNSSIIVWSSGSNTLNEFGFGDDITYSNEAPELRKQAAHKVGGQ